MSCISIRRIDTSLVAARSAKGNCRQREAAMETALLNRASVFMLKRFEKKERVPRGEFAKAACRSERGEIGNNPNNRCFFTVALQKDTIVGATAFTYFDAPSAMFGGYLVVSGRYFGKGIGRMLFDDRIAVCNEEAGKHNKKLAYTIAEVGIPALSADRAEAEKRLEIFSHLGAGVLDTRAGFTYLQPTEDGIGLPLHLLVKPLLEQEEFAKWQVVEIVAEIYNAIYTHVGIALRKSLLQRVVDTIPAEGLKIVRDLKEMIGMEPQ